MADGRSFPNRLNAWTLAVIADKLATKNIYNLSDKWIIL